MSSKIPRERRVLNPSFFRSFLSFSCCGCLNFQEMNLTRPDSREGHSCKDSINVCGNSLNFCRLFTKLYSLFIAHLILFKKLEEPHDEAPWMPLLGSHQLLLERWMMNLNVNNSSLSVTTEEWWWGRCGQKRYTMPAGHQLRAGGSWRYVEKDQAVPADDRPPSSFGKKSGQSNDVIH